MVKVSQNETLEEVEQGVICTKTLIVGSVDVLVNSIGRMIDNDIGIDVTTNLINYSLKIG